LFERFGRKSGSSPLRKHAERAANKRAQAIDRWEAIQALAAAGSSEAVEALLVRFTFYVEPSITDQDEKDAAFAGILRAGDEALGPVTAFLRKAESISWPLKILDQLAPAPAVVGKLLDVLSEMDTEYERDPQRKIQVLSALEERTDPRIVEAVERFLADANETVRFTAVGAVLAQAEAERARERIVDCLCDEESVRVRNRILQGFIERGWGFSERIEEVRPKLPPGYALDSKGLPRGPRR
jgi:HEAT repeat protein